EDDENRQRRQEPPDGDVYRRQRQQQPRERLIHDQAALLDDDVRALDDRARDEVEDEQPGEQVREVPDTLRPAADDVDEQQVDQRQQQRVDDEPHLTEERRGVRSAHVGVRERDGEVPAAPQLAEVRLEFGQSGAV